MTKSSTKTLALTDEARAMYLRRAKKLIIERETVNNQVADAFIASVNINIESLGFCLSKELLEDLKYTSMDSIKRINKILNETLARVKGAHRSHRPMYNNFPQEVMSKSDAELYFNAIIHYLSGGKLMPASAKEKRSKLNEMTDIVIIERGDIEDFKNIFTKIVSQNSSTTEQDKEDIKTYIELLKDDALNLIPDVIPNRENKAFVAAELIKHTDNADEVLKEHVSTATDVLRVAVAMSDGDVSLAEPVKFISFKRSKRQQLLSLLEEQKYALEDMLRWKKRWIRLGERLHPGEYKKKFPKSFDSFNTLRNDLPFTTFNSKIECLIEKNNVDKLVDELKSRPGDFARRLDKIIRIADKNKVDAVIDQFAGVVDKLSTPVLIQLMHHFKTRNYDRDIRVFFPKGDVTKAQAIENNLPKLSNTTCESIKEICDKALRKRFSKLPSLGKCYLDRKLINFMVPFAQRSASKSFRTISRGSRLSLPDKDTLRFFIWWKNKYKNSPVDLDLTAACFHEDFTFETVIAYHNLKTMGGHHSGDIVDAPVGASEFIDVSISKFLERDVRYIAMIVNSYSRHPFSTLPECFAGWMPREEPDSGEIYEAKTVENKLDVTADSKVTIPAIFDIVERKVIWADLNLRCHPGFNNNVVSNLYGVQLSIKSIVELEKPNLYDLFKLHIMARGEEVDTPEEADSVFSLDNETQFQLTKITSEFMA